MGITLVSVFQLFPGVSGLGIMTFKAGSLVQIDRPYTSQCVEWRGQLISNSAFVSHNVFID